MSATTASANTDRFCRGRARSYKCAIRAHSPKSRERRDRLHQAGIVD
jgi:hypothetical protein